MGKVTNAAKDAPYPYNLIRAIHGGDVPLEKLAPDIEQSVEYVLTNKMPEREARILQLKYRYGQKTREIAAQYCVTSQQISQMIHRGERMLRYPSRYRYLLVGCRVIAEREAQELQRAQLLAEMKEERIRSFLQPDRFPGPLSGISDTHDRVETILARCKLDTVHELGPSMRLYNNLLRAGIQYVWELCFLQPHELRRIHHVGQKQVEEVQRLLSQYQLALDDGALSACPELWAYADQKAAELKKLLQQTIEESYCTDT